MMSICRKIPTRKQVLAVLIAGLGLCISACDNSEQQSGPSPTDPAAYASGQTYTVRGVVTQLPDPTPPPKELKIHHEHIPDFIGKTGGVHINPDGTPGMRAMNMAFPHIAETIDIASYAVGDKVEFVFKVRWDSNPAGDPTPTWLVTELTTLDPETEISYENKPTP